MNGECVPTSGPGGGVPPCSTPSSGTFCVHGALLNFADNMPFTDAVHVALYDPLTLFGGGAPLSEADVNGGGYVFANVPTPSLGLIAIVTTGAAGSATQYTMTGTGDESIASGNQYRVDGYVTPKSITDGWKPAFDISTAGAVVAKFYSDPKPPVTLVQANEKNPVAGVQMTVNGGTTGVQYFGTSLSTIDGTLTATSAVGAALIAAPVSGSFPICSGMGPSVGPITWEQQPCGSMANAILVARLHPNM
jgi:hypothetical protein